MAYFPFMIDIRDKKWLVIGGGRVAFRKVELLLGFDACVKVIGEEICPAFREMEKEYRTVANKRTVDAKEQCRLEIVQRKFRENDLEHADYVIAATDDGGLNDSIAALCRQKNILVNVVDKKEASSFIFPAMIRDKDLLVAVSSGGNSPAASAYVKRRIQYHIPDYYGNMIEELGKYRDYVLKHVDTAKKRKEVFDKLLEYGDAHEGRISEDVVRKMIEEAADTAIQDKA